MLNHKTIFQMRTYISDYLIMVWYDSMIKTLRPEDCFRARETVVFLTMARQFPKHALTLSSQSTRIILILGVIVIFISIRFCYDLFTGWSSLNRSKVPWSTSGSADCHNDAKDRAVCDVGGFYRKGSSESQDQVFSSWRKKNQTLSVRYRS
jgi:hypothetical protein